MMSALLLVAALTAQIEIEVHYLPEGTSVELPSGEQAKAFTLGEYKQLLKMDAELWGSTRQLELSQKAQAAQLQALRESAYITNLLLEDLEIARGRARWLSSDLTACQEREIEEAGSIWSYVVGAIGVGFGLVGIGVAGGAYLAR